MHFAAARTPFVRSPWMGGWAPARRLGQAIPQDLAEILRRDGAIVSVEIAAPAAAAAKAGSPQVVKGMVDTGASISTVSEAVAQAAGLQAVASVPIGGVGGTTERPIYAASFGLTDYGARVDPIEIAGVTIPLTGVDVLIGRDVLKSLGLFEYRGPAGVFNIAQEGAPGARPGPSPTLYWVALAGGAALAAVVGLSALDVI